MVYMGIVVFRKKIKEKGIEVIEVFNIFELDKIREKDKSD